MERFISIKFEFLYFFFKNALNGLTGSSNLGSSGTNAASSSLWKDPLDQIFGASINASTAKPSESSNIIVSFAKKFAKLIYKTLKKVKIYLKNKEIGSELKNKTDRYFKLFFYWIEVESLFSDPHFNKRALTSRQI